MTVALARFAISRCAAAGIILSSVVTRYQLGLVLHAGSLIVPPSAFTLHGTCESAMNAAFSGLTSPANDAGDFPLSINGEPSTGGIHGETDAPRPESLITSG